MEYQGGGHHDRTHSRVARLFIVTVAVLVLAACRSRLSAVDARSRATRSPQREPTQTSSRPSRPQPAASGDAIDDTAGERTELARPRTREDPVAVRIYLVRGEKIGVAGRDAAAGTQRRRSRCRPRAPAAHQAAADVRYGLGTAIPRGTELRGLSHQERSRHRRPLEAVRDRWRIAVDAAASGAGRGNAHAVPHREARRVPNRRQARRSRSAARASPCRRRSCSTTSRTYCRAILVEGPTPGETVSTASGCSARRTSSRRSSTCDCSRAARCSCQVVRGNVGDGHPRHVLGERSRIAEASRVAATLEVFDISEKDGSRVESRRIPCDVEVGTRGGTVAWIEAPRALRRRS